MIKSKSPGNSSIKIPSSCVFGDDFLSSHMGKPYFYCCIAHNCAICVLDLWPKTQCTVGQQSSVSHTRCLFLFYFFSLHDPATPYPIELDKIIYNWHEVKDIYIQQA